MDMGENRWFKVPMKVYGSVCLEKPECQQLYLHLCSRAATTEITTWVGNREIKLRPGQLVAHRQRAAASTGLTEKQVINRLDVLEKARLIGRNSGHKITIITILSESAYPWQEGWTPPKWSPKRAEKGNQGGHQEGIKRDSINRDDLDDQEIDCAEQNSLFPIPPPTVPGKAASKPKAAWNGSAFAIPDALYETWEKAYPGVALEQEVNKAAAWIVANPKRAPKSNYTRFLNGWMGRAKPQPVVDAEDDYTLDPGMIEWCEAHVERQRQTGEGRE